MKLTRVERWILKNQYSILESLHPKDADFYKEAQEILRCGFELEYEEIVQDVYKDKDTLTEAECIEVIDILAMFDTLRYNYGQLKDKTEIEKHELDFQGFDGNDSKECSYMSYARFLCETQGKFKELTKGDFYNSHFPSLEMYRRMLSEYKKIENKNPLTKEDILRVVGEKIHPSRRN